MNTRDDTDYWRQNGANTNVSDTLRQILQIWKTGKNLGQEMERLQIQSSYSAMSWYCLLAGYGFYPDIRPMPADNPAASQINMTEIDELIRRCSMNFRSQNEQLRF
jgi:high-affinity Fe2+/Pb2+ permease